MGESVAYRIRIYTEEKAKVGAAAWGTEFIFNFFLHQDDLKNRMNSFFSSYHPVAIDLLFLS